MRARALLVLLALGGCGEEAAAERRAVGGFAVALPSGWRVAPELTHGLPSDAVASFPVRRGVTSDSCIPRRVLRAMPRDGALLFTVGHSRVACWSAAAGCS